MPTTLSVARSSSSDRIGLWPATYCAPSLRLCSTRRLAVSALLGGILIASSAAITARKLTALSRKQVPSPTSLITMPATDGPISRAPLNMKEFSAIAFGRSARSSSISTTNDCRVGMSNPITSPSSALRAMMCHTWITGVPSARFTSVRIARISAWSAATLCVTTSSARLFTRSASTPANGAAAKVRIWLLKPTTPRSSSDPVSLYTSQPRARFCIHVPISETPWPMKKRR